MYNGKHMAEYLLIKVIRIEYHVISKNSFDHIQNEFSLTVTVSVLIDYYIIRL